VKSSNIKDQSSDNNQTPSFKVLEFGIWNLFGFWCLKFGFYFAGGKDA